MPSRQGAARTSKAERPARTEQEGAPLQPGRAGRQLDGADLLHLQRTIGNRAVGRLLTGRVQREAGSGFLGGLSDPVGKIIDEYATRRRRRERVPAVPGRLGEAAPSSKPEETLGEGPRRDISAAQKSRLMRGVAKMRELQGYWHDHRGRYRGTLVRPPTFRVGPLSLRRGDTGKWALKRTAELYESLADKAVKWKPEGKGVPTLNRYIRAMTAPRKLKPFVKRALKTHKPYLLPLVDLESYGHYAPAKAPDHFGDISDIFSWTGVAVDALELAGLMRVLPALETAFAPLTMVNIVLSMFGYYLEMVKAHQVPERLSYALGLAYGIIGLALNQYPPKLPSRATRPAEYRKGYEQAKTHYDKTLKRGPAARLAVGIQFQAIRRMGGGQAIKVIWPHISAKALEGLHVTQGQYKGAYNLGWPPF